jgi:putative Holliday junction resolvase
MPAMPDHGAGEPPELAEFNEQDSKNAKGTLIAFDFGLKRIGVAVGETLLANARGLAVVAHSASGPDWPAIEKILHDWQPALLLVGYPCNMDGSPSEMSRLALQFAGELRKRSGIRVQAIDERLSSSEALDQLREERRDGLRKRRISRGLIDQEAARLILQQWMSEAS